jgi:hypothetical protein
MGSKEVGFLPERLRWYERPGMAHLHPGRLSARFEILDNDMP